MKTCTAILFLLCIYLSSLSARGFDEFIKQLKLTPIIERPALVDDFMSGIPSFPYLEQDTLVHFIYRGNVSSISIVGDANGWDKNVSPMTHIVGTDFWYRSEVYENDARLEYKFVVNDTSWILDPLNPNTISGGFGPNSELRMPAYTIPPEIEPHPDISHGMLIDTLFYSKYLGNTRTIHIFLPPGYHMSSDSFPLLLVHDGLDYLSLANAENTLNYLINQGSIQPMIGVFVPPVNRTAEYAGNLQDKFTDFIISEVIPYMDSHFRTIPDARHRATLGASNGGNISLWLGMTHPEIFGNIAAHSSYIEPSIIDGFRNGPKKNLRIDMNLGTYDLPVIIPLVHRFVSILQSKGYAYQYREYHEGHSWGLWRAHIDDALKMFFPVTQ